MAARCESKNEVARIYLAHATVRVAEFGNSAHAVESSAAALSLAHENTDSPGEQPGLMATAPLPSTPYPAYLRGLAYLRLNEPTKAANQFQKLVDHRGCVQSFFLGALVSSAVGTCICGPWRQDQGARGVSRLPHAVERRRPGHSHSHCRQLWVGKAPLVPSRGRRFAPPVPRTNPCQWTISCMEANVKGKTSPCYAI
jgi:hypothetical protein